MHTAGDRFTVTETFSRSPYWAVLRTFGRSPRVEPAMLLALSAALMLTVSPATAGKHDRVAAAITLPRSTGVFGQTRRSYAVEAHAVQAASACVNNRDRVFRE